MKNILLICMQFVFAISMAQPILEIVKNGKSDYKIIIPKYATNEEKKAADIFREYIKRISSVDLDIKLDDIKTSSKEIVIGNTNRSNSVKGLKNTFVEDAYRIKTKGDKLFIQGGKGKGIIYGVTGFLEDYLGCRKYSPTVEYIPNNKNISLKSIDDTQKPASVIRIINGTLCSDEDYRNWRKLSLVHEKWGSNAFDGYFVHTFNRLVPREEYFESHPEYFSMIAGKRVPYGQLCLTNPEVFDLTVKKLKQVIAEHPGIKYWSVSQNDNYEYCECPQCKVFNDKEGAPSGALIRFVNKVAKEFPDKIITTLAYQYSRKPPKYIKPAKNVMITLCTIELNRNEPIEVDPTSKDFVDDITSWSKICKNIMLWDYEVQFTNYLCPFPLFHTLKPNIDFFNVHNVTAHFQQCNVQYGNEFAELKAYLISKLLWNPKISTDSVINDFMTGYYAEAGKYLKKYFDLLHLEGRKSKQRLDIYDAPTSYANTFLSERNLNKYSEILDSAENAVSSTPDILERVKIARLPLMYSELEISKSDVFGERGFFDEINGKFILKPSKKKLLEDFLSILKKNNIPSLNETNLTPDIYHQNFLRIIDIKAEGNLAFRKPTSCSPMPAEKYFCSGPGTLTNGIQGTMNHKLDWLGWENQDFEMTIDLEKSAKINEINVSTLQVLSAWITHPTSIICSSSTDGIVFTDHQTLNSEFDLRKEPDIKNFLFALPNIEARFIRLKVSGTKVLPSWHLYSGNKSWVFVDEVTIK